MMERKSFSRDELLAALRTVTQFLQGFPDMEFGVTEEHAPPRRAMPSDGSIVTATTQPPDGSLVTNGYGKGIPQPPRKRHTIAPKVKIDRVDWDGIPRAARRIAEDLSTHGPATSHELMARLHIARPTFNNAMSKLRKKRLVQSVGLRGGGEARV